MHRTPRAPSIGLLTVILVLLAGLLVTSPVAAAPDPDEPTIRTATSTLARSLVCSPGVDQAATTPVLLVHGTRVTARENWSLVYLPSLTQLGIPWCYVKLPQRATGDIQISAEYVVHAIREMYDRAHRPVSVIGASQGGMLPRWALRFWPSLRPMVDDLVALAPTNHGTESHRDACAQGPCLPAEWQQAIGSKFMSALNSGQETFPGISYTNIYSHADTTVTPNQDDTGSSSLHGGGGAITNVAVQDVCPTSNASHIMVGLFDRIGFNLALDALAHLGPANVSTVKSRGCHQPAPPGFNPLPLLLSVPGLLASNLLGVGMAAKTDHEPALRCYAGGAC